jgi:hypothetical protein
MDQDRLPIGAAELLAYFEGVSRQDADPHWRRGADLCREWLVFRARPATQADIDQFVARLQSEPTPSTGWFDLGMQFRTWARAQGFDLSDQSGKGPK